MSVLVEDGKKGLKLFTKGATEIILKCCVKYYKYDSG
jgi:magnesium-transporting ATPase (P-type)